MRIGIRTDGGITASAPSRIGKLFARIGSGPRSQKPTVASPLGAGVDGASYRDEFAGWGVQGSGIAREINKHTRYPDYIAKHKAPHDPAPLSDKKADKTTDEYKELLIWFQGFVDEIQKLRSQRAIK